LQTKKRQSGANAMRLFMAHERRAIKARLVQKYGATCQLCLAKGYSKHEAKIDMDTNNLDRSWSVDHIVPMGLGGKNVESNMWPAHRKCNSDRGTDSI